MGIKAFKAVHVKIDTDTTKPEQPKKSKFRKSVSPSVRVVSTVEEKENGSIESFNSEPITDLGSSEYRDLNSPAVISLDDKHKVYIRVKRSEESSQDLGLLYLDIQHWISSEVFTGYTKQKVHIPLYKLPELKMLIEDALCECDKKGLLKQSADEWKD